MTKDEIEKAVAHFCEIQERKKLPPERRWSKSDQLLAQALIANGFETVHCYRERQGDDFCHSVLCRRAVFDDCGTD